MEFVETSERAELRRQARRFLAQASTSDRVRRAMATETGFDPEIWSTLATELGWTALTVPEAYGGLGMGQLELSVLLEELGRALGCVPLFSSVCLGINAILLAGDESQRATWLPALAEGEARATLALAEKRGSWDPADVELEASSAGDGVTLSGHKRFVPDGHTADLIVVVARTPGTVRREGLELYVVPRDAEGLTRRALPTVDQTRKQAALDFDAVHVPKQARLSGSTPSVLALEACLERAAAGLAAEQVGAAERCLEMAVDYAKVRTQFGRPIGSFQAIKHKCADMFVRVESARSAAISANAAIDACSPDAAEATAAAQAYCSDTLLHCAGENIQIHGGVGFTWEHDAHLYFKRARSAATLLGDARLHRERVAAALGRGRVETELKLSDAETRFRDECRRWLEEHLSGEFAHLRGRGGPGDDDIAIEGRMAWTRKMAEAGYNCIGWPTAHGGRGVTLREEVVFNEEYVRARGPGKVGHIGETLLGPTLMHFGTAAQQQRFLPKILAGEELWCQGYSEPNAGSDLANVQTRAVRDGDEWVITGQKVWTSHAAWADWCFVLVRTDMGAPKHKGLSYLLVPMKQPGVDIVPIVQMTGGDEFAEVFFDGARTSADQVVGDVNGGWRVAMGTLAFERGASTLAQQLGFQLEFDELVAIAAANGAADDPVLRPRLADAAIGLRIMRLNALRMLGMDGVDLSREAMIGKLYWSNWHRDFGELAMDVLGAAGDVLEDGPYGLSRLQRAWLFSRSDTIYAGSNQIQRNIIGERALGLPREPRTP